METVPNLVVQESQVSRFMLQQEAGGVAGVARGHQKRCVHVTGRFGQLLFASLAALLALVDQLLEEVFVRANAKHIRRRGDVEGGGRLLSGEQQEGVGQWLVGW